MARIKIELPRTFPFSCTIPVRITDVNYGGHVGNDTVLSIIHEARMQFLKNAGYSELDIAGVGLIMSDVGIEFKSELFYGDVISCEVAVQEIGKVTFDIVYRLQCTRDNKDILVAIAKTGMVCYDYKAKKIVAVPETVKNKLAS